MEGNKPSVSPAMLADLGLQVASANNTREFIQLFERNARRIIGARLCGVIVINKNENAVHEFYIGGIDQSEILKNIEQTARGLSWVDKNYSVIRTHNKGLKMILPGLPEPLDPVLQVHSLLQVPFHLKEKMEGYLSFGDKLADEQFTDDDERRAITLAAQFAVHYENAFQRQQLQLRVDALEKEVTERKAVEIKLRKLSSALEQGTDNVIITNKDGIIEYVSPGFEKTTGYSEEEVLGKKPSILKSGQHNREFYSRLWTSLNAGNTFQAQFINKKKDGSFYYEEQAISPIKSETGVVTHYVSTGKDITSYVLTQAALKESEERYRFLFNSNPQPMWVYDLETLSFLAVNDATVAQYQYAKEEFATMTIKDIRPPDELPALMQSLQDRTRFRKSGIWKHRRKDGSIIFVEIISHELEFMGRNARLVLASDITEQKLAQDALRESEARFRQIAENISEVFWITNPDVTEMLYISPAYETIWGRSLESLYNDPISFMDAIHPDDRVSVHSEIGKLMEQGKFEQQYRIIQPGGNVRWIWARGFPIHNEAGQIVRIAGIAQDITASKKAEIALRQSEERFRMAFEEGPVGMALVDRNNNFITINAAFCELVGYAEKELKTLSFTELTHPVDRDRVTSHSLQLFAGSIRNYELQIRYIRKTGKIVWVKTTASLISDAEEQSTYAFVMSENIHEKKQAGEHLKAQHSVTRVLAESTFLKEASLKILEILCTTFDWDFGTVWCKDPSGKFMQCEEVWRGQRAAANELEEATRTFRFAKGEDLPGKVWESESPITLPDIQTERWFSRQAVARRANLRYCVAFPISSGSDVNGVMEFFSDEPQAVDVGISGIMRAVTTQFGQFIERKKSEELKTRLEKQLQQSQRIEAIGQLAGGVAHDFNNTLMAISGYSELLQMHAPEGHPLHKIAQEIQKSTERGASLTKQLLAFSRRQVLSPKLIDLNNSVKEMLSMLQRLIGEDVQLSTALDKELGYVRADPGQIQQILMNLVVNARDAMPAGGKLTIETKTVELDEEYSKKHVDVVPGNYVLLAVSDTGHGMSEDILSHIFEPFFTTKGEGKGTGLGLSTVYGIVKQSGGHIFVYSQIGHGTSFKIYLPRLNDEGEKYEPAPVSKHERKGAGELLLLVDDNESIRDAVGEFLRLKGYQVLTASTGMEALTLLKSAKTPINLLISDIVMPEMSGRDLAKEVHDLFPEAKVIYMSGYADEAIKSHGILDPGSTFFSKPISMQNLLTLIEQVLSSR